MRADNTARKRAEEALLLAVEDREVIECGPSPGVDASARNAARSRGSRGHRVRDRRRRVRGDPPTLAVEDREVIECGMTFTSCLICGPWLAVEDREVIECGGHADFATWVPDPLAVEDREVIECGVRIVTALHVPFAALAVEDREVIECGRCWACSSLRKPSAREDVIKAINEGYRAA